jgi:phytoene dehydrogenase-like protein
MENESPMKDVAVIGAGLAGLYCALRLESTGLDVALLEAADAPGGRVRTDVVEGFRLDRGFQVLLTAYPEARSALDYEALDLKKIKPGALVWHAGRFHRFVDPFREPLAGMKFAFDPIVTFADKLRVARLRRSVCQSTPAQLFEREEMTTATSLARQGFSPAIRERFFTPFFGGVFLEREMRTSSRYFEFLFRMFASGDAAVPRDGMEAIPQQMAAKLRSGTLTTNAVVKALRREKLVFAIDVDGSAPLRARAVVLATPEPEMRRLLQSLPGAAPAKSLAKPRSWNRTTTFYYAADRPPVQEPILMLNGEGRAAGPVNHAMVMTEVSRAYAPAGAHLISASVVGEAPNADAAMTKLEEQVREHLREWFPSEADRWEPLGGFQVQYALPMQRVAEWEKSNNSVAGKAGAGIFACGDFLETASIQGALASGRRAAAATIATLKRSY